MPEKNPDEVVLKIRVRREVVAAFAPAAAYARTTTPQLMRELIPYVVGMLDGPPAQWPEVLERIRQENLAKGAGKAPHVAPKVLDDEGKPIREVMNKLTVKDVAAMDDATIRVLYRELRHFRDTMPEAADDAIFERFQHMPDPE